MNHLEMAKIILIRNTCKEKIRIVGLHPKAGQDRENYDAAFKI